MQVGQKRAEGTDRRWQTVARDEREEGSAAALVVAFLAEHGVFGITLQNSRVLPGVLETSAAPLLRRPGTPAVS